MAFTIRRAEYFIPAGLLLKCFVEVTDRELFEKVVQSAVVVRFHNPDTGLVQLTSCDDAHGEDDSGVFQRLENQHKELPALGDLY